MLAAIVLAGVVAASHGPEVGRALDSVSPWALGGAIGLHLLTLVARTEAWRLTLASAGADALSRPVVHRVSAAAYVAGAVQSQAAMPTRVAVLRGLAGDRAPRPGQICVADVPIFALEVCGTSALLTAAVLAGRGPWWIAPAAATLAAIVLTGSRLLPDRFAHRPIVRGLAILADRRRRGALVALVAAICTITATRAWLALLVCGLPHGLGDVAWLFAALGIFGLLPLGPGGPPSAALATIGAANAGGAVAAGLVLSVSGVAAVLAYALAVAVGLRTGRVAAGGLARQARPGATPYATEPEPTPTPSAIRSTSSVDQPKLRAPSPRPVSGS